MMLARIAVSAVTRSARVTEIYPRPEAVTFLGGGFSGEDAAVRRGRALLRVLAAACEQAEAGVSALS